MAVEQSRKENVCFLLHKQKQEEEERGKRERQSAMHFVVSHTINPFASNHNTSTTTLFPLFPLPAEMSFVGPPNAEAKVEQVKRT